MKTYNWKDGSRYSVDPAIVGNTLERLERKYGAATPEKLVAEAKRSKTIHSLFEWDDSKAAHQFRIGQARKVIQNITVIIETKPGKAVEMRAFEVVNRGEGEYRSISAIMKNPEDRAEILNQAMRDLRMWQARYRKLSEYADAFAKVVEAVEALELVAANLESDDRPQPPA